MPVAQVHRSDIAVCGRRDVSLPRSIQKRRQKDEETRLTWYLKDEVMRRSRVYYAKLAGQLVDEGYAIRLRQGIYALASSKNG